MLFARLAGTLAVLVLLSACFEGRGDASEGPRLPAIELPATTVGAPYEAVLTATGGTPPLRYSFVGAPPPGFSFYTADSKLTGPATEAGEFNITVGVRDADKREDVRTYSLRVLPAPGDVPGTFPLAVANWNIEWFGDTTFGPSDEPLQLSNAQAVIAEAGADIWGLGEIVSTAQFNELKARLPGYDGFLADDATRVSSGTGYYTASEQKLGVLFRSDLVRVLRADVVLGQYDYDFGSRPPLRVDLRVTRGDASVDVTVLVVHLKALTSTEDYERRLAASRWLKDYLETSTTLPPRVMVIGDWNDDVDVSTTRDPATQQRRDTPFRNFVNDTARYAFTTQALSLANVGSTVGRTTFIDHQLVTNELAADYVPNSATVLRPAIYSYGSTTSDHYPVLSRFDFGTAQGRGVRVTAPNGGETLNAGTVYTITWTASDVVETVRVQYSLDDGLTWRDVAASVPASSGRYAWTVPYEASTGARVQVSDASDSTLSDLSDNAFTMRRAPPQVFINEYLPQPNNVPNTTTPDYDQQFVELVNTGTTSVDLGGWKLHDAKSYSGAEPTRHTFPAGTVLAPGKVYVVYSGPTAYTGAPNTAYANGNDGLRFNRGINDGSSGDSVYLILPDGTVQDSTSYQDTYPGTSYNRSPDVSATGTWVLHSTLSSTRTASPGLRANGTAF